MYWINSNTFPEKSGFYWVKLSDQDGKPFIELVEIAKFAPTFKMRIGEDLDAYLARLKKEEVYHVRIPFLYVDWVKCSGFRNLEAYAKMSYPDIPE